MAIFKKRKNIEKPTLTKQQVIEKLQSGELHKPEHIAFIMDGNGRWAKQRGLLRSDGHKSAETAIRTAVLTSIDFGIDTVTLYAFSTENWSRSEEEKRVIFGLLEDFLHRFFDECIERETRVVVIGDVEPFAKYGLSGAIANIQEKTAHLEKRTLNIALNYGSRQEIIRACNKAIELGKPITEEDFEKLLYTGGQKDPDLIVRTSGENRLSNFLLYQSAYAEFYFPECLWPDFDENECVKAIVEYSSRKRRFGKA